MRLKILCEKCKGARGRYLYGAPGMWRPCTGCNGTGLAVSYQHNQDPQQGEGK